MINLKKRRGVPDEDAPHLISTAEAATLQLEFRYLSWLTDEEIYWEKVQHVSDTSSRVVILMTSCCAQIMETIKAARLPHGLASIFMSYVNGRHFHCDN
jgi:mannosyl-oligosaccharide alpha-1,2-mannosidase